jgi:flagellin-like protein
VDVESVFQAFHAYSYWLFLGYGFLIHNCYLTSKKNKNSLKLGQCSRSRKGISEVVGSLLAIAITVIAGAAVFGYVNSQAGVSERLYGSSVGGTVQFLEERYTVVQVNYTNSAVTIWLYNMGQINLSPVQVLLYNNGRSLYVLYNATKVISYQPTGCATVTPPGNKEVPLMWNAKTGTGLSVPIQTVQRLTLTLPCTATESFSTGTTYTVSVLGVNGNVVVYSQTR